MRTIPSGGLPGRPIAAVVALVGIASGVLVGQGGLDTVVGCGSPADDYPSRTARDWVTNADHVVVATTTAERDADKREIDSGPVQFVVSRTVTFRADAVLWSAQRPRHTLDKDFDMEAAGWSVYRNSGTRIKRTTAAAPRLEPGHTYVLALRWESDRWVVLGEGAAVPFDDRTAGRGEWCGRVLSEDDVALGERFSRLDDDSLEEDVKGQDERAVVRELEQARKPTPGS
ncbi:MULTISPECIES: hypothetical protein [Streptomyces]|uniref:Secreted protein n=1 Tax=Streptomyces lienomycini TaxID=284035 RepID=A0ABV9WNQ9_9ACTN|nr:MULTISPECIES: hypothetical protein [Streptomyces]